MIAVKWKTWLIKIEYAIKLVWEEDKLPFPWLSLKSDPSKASCNKISSQSIEPRINIIICGPDSTVFFNFGITTYNFDISYKTFIQSLVHGLIVP